MNFDINKIMGVAKIFMPNKMKQFEQAINKAQEVMNNSKGMSGPEILKNAGVPMSFIDMLRKNTSNSTVGNILQTFGLDVNQANDVLDSIKASDTTSSPISSNEPQAKNDDIEMLKQALNKVKKN